MRPLSRGIGCRACAGAWGQRQSVAPLDQAAPGQAGGAGVDGSADLRNVDLYSGGRGSADCAAAGHHGWADIATGALEGVAAERGTA